MDAPVYNKLDEILTEIKTISGKADYSDYKNIVAAIRNGNINAVPNGQEFDVPHSVYGTITFITRAKNYFKVAGDPTRPNIAIMPKFLLSVNGGSSVANFQYDRQEAFQEAPIDYPAGTVFNFTCPGYGGWLAGTYHFTAPQAVPAGSKFCISDYQNVALLNCKVRIFDNAKSATATQTLDILEGEESGGVDLGTWGTNANHPHHVSYGSNNDAQSGLLQFLNGSGLMSDNFFPSTKYDMMPTAFTSLQGFYGGFPEDFRECLALCRVHNVSNNVYEEAAVAAFSRSTAYAVGDYCTYNHILWRCVAAHAAGNWNAAHFTEVSAAAGFTKSSEYEYDAHFFLPSRKEIYGTNETSFEEAEEQFAYYAELGTTDQDKLMSARGGSPATYWLRTPFASFANLVRLCTAPSGGALDNNIAIFSTGVAPLGILA